MRLYDSPEWSVQAANGLWYTLSHLVYGFSPGVG